MRVAPFESNTGNFTIYPYVTESNSLTHIEINTRTGTIIVNKDDLNDFCRTIQELTELYIK